ncbi:hypothetical protein JCM5353_005840 [Sporobolomyces roseus]
MRSFTLLAAVAAFLPAVFAQSEVPVCVVTCIGEASALTSCQSADSQCLCSSPTFIDGVTACMIQSCDEQALTFGIQFGEQYCASAGVSVSIPSALGEATATGSADQTAASSSAAQADATSAASAISSVASSASQSIVSSGTVSSPAAPTESTTSDARPLTVTPFVVLAGAGMALLF